MAKHSEIPGMIEKIVQSRLSLNITFRDEKFLCDILQKLIKNGENIHLSAEEADELDRIFCISGVYPDGYVRAQPHEMYMM